MDERWLSTAAVAQRIGLAASSVRQISPAELPYLAVGRRGTRRYRAADVSEYLAARSAYELADVDRLMVRRGPYRKAMRWPDVEP